MQTSNCFQYSIFSTFKLIKKRKSFQATNPRRLSSSALAILPAGRAQLSRRHIFVIFHETVYSFAQVQNKTFRAFNGLDRNSLLWSYSICVTRGRHPCLHVLCDTSPRLRKLHAQPVTMCNLHCPVEHRKSMVGRFMAFDALLKLLQFFMVGHSCHGIYSTTWQITLDRRLFFIQIYLWSTYFNSHLQLRCLPPLVSSQNFM